MRKKIKYLVIAFELLGIFYFAYREGGMKAIFALCLGIVIIGSLYFILYVIEKFLDKDKG